VTTGNLELDCAEVRELLGPFMARSLSEEGMERVAAHLAGCESCRRLLAAANADLTAETTALPGTLPPPPDGPAGDLSDLTRRLLEAHAMLKGVAHRTPVATSRTLDEETGCEVFLKCETQQRMGAFKFRGAFHTITKLPPDQRAGGVVAYSSGNHAQAVALVAKLHGIPSTIVMPSDAPPAKIAATRGYGAEVVFYDSLGEEREALAKRLALERHATLVPPFDHPDILAGAGTAALELFEEVGPLDALLVPVGGGGLISGSGLAARHACPACSVFGVEPEAGPDAMKSFQNGRLMRRKCGETIADGARTPQLSSLTFDVIRQTVAGITVVPDSELISAMRFVMERMKLVVEPTGVLGLAGLRSGRAGVSFSKGDPRQGWPEPLRGDQRARVGVILSGGNVDFAKLGEWFGATGDEA
jgi:threonine dehydratase